MLYRKHIKRPMDFILAFLAVIALTPILALIALLIRIKLGRPVILRQQRPGLDEKIFTLYKFRTMTDEKDSGGKLLPDDKRLTHFGSLLRSSSLDELPELFNIIRGDMSVVGPRPLLIQYLPLYNNHQRRRHEVRPGLSGLAQVNGRNAIRWEQRFDLDVKYADEISFRGDCRIICQTIKKVFTREGINSETSATMEPFSGSVEGRVNK